MRDPKPRKLPRQARSKATVDAILEAAARLLRRGDYAAVTTNHVAAAAGVSIGTLYEFFPNKEAIVAALVEARLRALVAVVSDDLEKALALDERGAAEFLIRRIVDLVSADRALYRVLLRQAPFVQGLAATREATATLFELARRAGERARDRLNLPNLEADTWLVSRMLYNAVLEIAFLENQSDDDAMDRRVLTDELVRLTFRMLQGRDPAAVKRPRRRAGTRAAPFPSSA